MDSNRRLHILVVEDEADVAETIALLFRQRMSADVDIVGDCKGARIALAGADIDLVTIDYNLPDGNGIDFLEEFSQDVKAPPMIIVTGKGGEEIAARSLRARAAGYVIKNASLPIALLHSAQHAVELSRAEKALAESHDLFQQMFDNMSSCVAIYRPVEGGEDFVFADFNKAAERVERVRREDIIGRSVLEVFPGVKDFGLFEVLQRVSRTGLPGHFPAAEYRDERVAGWKENYVYRLSGGEIVAIYDDVTEEKEAERALVASEAKYRFLADNMNDVVWTTDLELNLTYVSPSIEKVLGFIVEEKMKQPLDEQLTPDSLREALDRMSNELEHDQGRDPDRTDVLELYYFHKNGSERCLETSLSFIRDEEGKPTGIYGLARDVTERVIAQEAIRKSAEELKDLVDLAAHELRHPATIFKGYSTMLLEHGNDLDSEIVRDALHAIDRGADRLADLITKLLDTSRIERIGLSLQIEEVDPEEIVLGALGEVLTRTTRVINVRPEGTIVPVLIDRDKIREVLSILLDNAVTHAPDQAEIDVHFEQRDGETVFFVADRGPGIPEDAREKIFERFSQVEDVSHHSKPGIGLGLYIARTYVEAHKGWIKVEQRPGGGSIFSFAVPMER